MFFSIRSTLGSKCLLTNRINQLHNIYRKMKVDQCSVTSHFVKFVMIRILADGMVTYVSVRHE
jgi:hypothetical protein